MAGKRGAADPPRAAKLGRAAQKFISPSRDATPRSQGLLRFEQGLRTSAAANTAFAQDAFWGLRTRRPLGRPAARRRRRTSRPHRRASGPTTGPRPPRGRGHTATHRRASGPSAARRGGALRGAGVQVLRAARGREIEALEARALTTRRRAATGYDGPSSGRTRCSASRPDWSSTPMV